MSTFSPGPVSILLDISMSLSSNSSLWCFSILTTGHIFLLHRVCHCTEGALPTRMLCSEVHVYLIKKGMPLFFGHTHTVVSKLMWSSVVVELVCYFTSLFSFYLIQFTTNFNSLSGTGWGLSFNGVWRLSHWQDSRKVLVLFGWAPSFSHYGWLSSSLFSGSQLLELLGSGEVKSCGKRLPCGHRYALWLWHVWTPVWRSTWCLKEWWKFHSFLLKPICGTFVLILVTMPGVWAAVVSFLLLKVFHFLI